jgi:hypothetical protein
MRRSGIIHHILSAIFVFFTIIVLIKITFHTGDLSADEMMRYSLSVGISLSIKVLWSIGTEVVQLGLPGILMVSCLPVGIGIWVMAQTLTLNSHVRDALISLGSALTGVFLGSLNRLLGTGTPTNSEGSG